PTPRWSVKILPVQKITNWPEGEVRPHYAIDGDSSIPDQVESSTPSRLTFSIVPTKTDTAPTGVIDFVEPRVMELISHIRTTQTTKPFFKLVKPSVHQRLSLTTTSITATTTTPPPPSLRKPLKPKRPLSNRPAPSTSQSKCGVAPDFTPCVSSEQASHALLECCRRKNLPPGCQSLCRYDITQAEVRAAMDRGQCGIFSVAPFLECASQGKDNSECCRYKGLAQKTGPQCEQFCRPTQGLSALGLQHIVCGNGIGDMLQCHHAGIRR
ncbi:DB module, partial [Cooperia oncophora]